MGEGELLDWFDARCESLSVIFRQPDQRQYVIAYWLSWEDNDPEQEYVDIGGVDRLDALRNAAKLTWYRMYRPDQVTEARPPDGGPNVATYLDEH